MIIFSIKKYFIFKFLFIFFLRRDENKNKAGNILLYKFMMRLYRQKHRHFISCDFLLFFRAKCRRAWHCGAHCRAQRRETTAVAAACDAYNNTEQYTDWMIMMR